MKKTILGATMFLAGLISSAVFLSGPTGIQWTNNDNWASAWWLLSNYGLIPVLYVFVAITIIGLAIALWGVFERNKLIMACCT